MDVFEAIRERRSVRRFLPDPVDDEDLQQIFDAARYAPSGGNLQPWHYVVVRERETLARMVAAIKRRVEELEKSSATRPGGEVDVLASAAARFRFASLFFATAPVTIAVLVEPNPHAAPLLERLVEDGLDRYEAHRKLGFVDMLSVAAGIQNLLLAAHALGYGTCWMNVPFIASEDLEQILDVSPPRELIALVPLGRPAPDEPRGHGGRKAIDEIVTFA